MYKRQVVRWENSVPVISIDDNELQTVVEHIHHQYFTNYNLADKEINGLSPNNLGIKNQRININIEDIKELFGNLNNNIFQYLFSPWIQAGSINDKGVSQWSYVTPFLAANSNVFKPDSFENVKPEDIFSVLKDNFKGWDFGFSVDNLNLAGEQTSANICISLLALYGGLSDLPLSQFGLGSDTNNNRLLPLPGNWVDLNELITLTYGLGYFGEVDNLSYIFGENNKEKSQKILEGRLIIK